MNISVAMATYNGGKYIEEQLDSILSQLGEDDEIVISDDGSTDKTLDIVRSFHDERIKVFDGPRKGVKQNFGNAISKCVGKYIFLADQDDVWLPNKVATILSIFEEKKCTCVIHDAVVFDSDSGKIMEPSFFSWRKSGKGILKNIWKNTYIGCCMAFSADMKKYILPIPDNINMHDQWIGIICERYGKSIFVSKILLRYRRHSDNNSKMRHSGALRMLSTRLKLIYEFWGVR